MEGGNLDLIARTRGVLVLDDELFKLATELRNFNFHIITPYKSLTDDDYRRDMLAGRVFITNSPEPFLQSASELDCGIIDINNLKGLRVIETAIIISKVITHYKLCSKKHGYVITLMRNGQHKFKPLVD